MLAFFKPHGGRDEVVAVNAAEVRIVRPMSTGTLIEFARDHTITVSEAFDDVARALQDALG